MRFAARLPSWKIRGLALAAAAGCAMLVCAHAASSATALLKVRMGGDTQQTRIVIDLDQAASGKLVSDGADGRAVVVLSGVLNQLSLQGTGQGPVKTWLIDQTGAGARLQMDLAPEARVKRRFLLPPADGIEHYRYVIDVSGPEQVTLAKSTIGPANIARPSIAAPTMMPTAILTKSTQPVALQLRPQITPVSNPAFSTARAALSLKKVVVIDAGHGGHDPGAQGQTGWEKDVNLAAAKSLKDRLERTGRYRVVMTRDEDVYVPLESRVRIAQGAHADLFISLHSDSGPNPDISGASVYTLSEKASSRGQRFASRDDWFMKASLTGDTGVRDILFDLTQRATKNRSASFAQTIVGRLDGKAPLLRRSQRDAGFMVLLAPDVPAVLLEMGFVSNASDEQFLRDAGRRGRMMNAVGDAIDDYFAQATRLAAR